MTPLSLCSFWCVKGDERCETRRRRAALNRRSARTIWRTDHRKCQMFFVLANSRNNKVKSRNMRFLIRSWSLEWKRSILLRTQLCNFLKASDKKFHRRRRSNNLLSNLTMFGLMCCSATAVQLMWSENDLFINTFMDVTSPWTSNALSCVQWMILNSSFNKAPWRCDRKEKKCVRLVPESELKN